MVKQITITLNEDEEFHVDNTGFTKIELIGISEYIKEICVKDMIKEIEFQNQLRLIQKKDDRY